MLNFLKDILENREDAYARALAVAEAEIAQSGGGWFGAGSKGAILLMKSGTYLTLEDGNHYRRAGLELLLPALEAAKLHRGIEVDTLNYLSGCAFAASAKVDGHYEKALAQFALFHGEVDLSDNEWDDWQYIMLAAAAEDAGEPDAAKTHFQAVSDRHPERAATYFEHWQNRKSAA